MNPPEDNRIICNTSPVRHFAVAGEFDLLVAALGDQVLVPREVFDPDEDPGGPASIVSEIGASERFFANRSDIPEMANNWGRILELRQRSDITVVDVDETELQSLAELQSTELAREFGFAVALGRGEAAVIAIAESRGWHVVLDDRPARHIFSTRCPDLEVVTSRLLLRQSAGSLIDSDQAQIIYDRMRANGYRGPASLWEDVR